MGPAKLPVGVSPGVRLGLPKPLVQALDAFMVRLHHRIGL